MVACGYDPHSGGSAVQFKSCPAGNRASHQAGCHRAGHRGRFLPPSLLDIQRQPPNAKSLRAKTISAQGSDRLRSLLRTATTGVQAPPAGSRNHLVKAF